LAPQGGGRCGPGLPRAANNQGVVGARGPDKRGPSQRPLGQGFAGPLGHHFPAPMGPRSARHGFSGGGRCGRAISGHRFQSPGPGGDLRRMGGGGAHRCPPGACFFPASWRKANDARGRREISRWRASWGGRNLRVPGRGGDGVPENRDLMSAGRDGKKHLGPASKAPPLQGKWWVGRGSQGRRFRPVFVGLPRPGSFLWDVPGVARTRAHLGSENTGVARASKQGRPVEGPAFAVRFSLSAGAPPSRERGGVNAPSDGSAPGGAGLSPRSNPRNVLTGGPACCGQPGRPGVTTGQARTSEPAHGTPALADVESRRNRLVTKNPAFVRLLAAEKKRYAGKAHAGGAEALREGLRQLITCAFRRDPATGGGHPKGGKASQRHLCGGTPSPQAKKAPAFKGAWGGGQKPCNASMLIKPPRQTGPGKGPHSQGTLGVFPRGGPRTLLVVRGAGGLRCCLGG